jgi:dienelactone hydrolase
MTAFTSLAALPIITKEERMPSGSPGTASFLAAGSTARFGRDRTYRKRFNASLSHLTKNPWMREIKINNPRTALQLLAVAIVIFAIVVAMHLSSSSQGWQVTGDGLLQYSTPKPECHLKPSEITDECQLFEVAFESKDQQIEGLLLKPKTNNSPDGEKVGLPGIVLLPGATVTKEREQGLARYLCSLGFASLTLDQRNLGGIDIQGDLQSFLDGVEPTEHKMVYDALAAAEILRAQPDIDPDRIIYVGESNGGRFAIIACALDPKALGVIAISTCGYGTGSAISSGKLQDPDMIRFFKSIDPDTYLDRIPPRKFVMIHSRNDTLIPCELAEGTYAKASRPKEMHLVGCTMHGYCSEMSASLEEEMKEMDS